MEAGGNKEDWTAGIGKGIVATVQYQKV